MPVKSKPNELKILRVYDAPVKAVWDAWTDPDQVGKWWGPRGFTITTHSKDLRVGGVWHYTMHGPDGTDWINKTKYFEVEKYSKLVYDHGGNDEREPLFRVTVTFSEKNGKTSMDMTMALPTAAAAAEAKKFIKQAGGNGTWDRLAEHLSKERSGEERFFINRSFDSSIDAVFKMWTDPKHIAMWLPPTGFSMKFRRADIKKGGGSFYEMDNDSGVQLFGRTEYLEIEKPHRIVYTQQFCDENEKVSRHPMAPLWPETLLTTVTLTAEADDQTRVTIEWQPHGAATKEEVAAFVKEKGGMTQGWTGSFDKLEESLAQMQK